MHLYRSERDNQQTWWKVICLASVIFNILLIGYILLIDNEVEQTELAPAIQPPPEATSPEVPSNPTTPVDQVVAVDVKEEKAKPDQQQVDGYGIIGSRIEGSLIQTLGRKLPSPEADWLAAHVGRILMWSINIQRDLHKNDQLGVVYEFDGTLDGIRIKALDFKGADGNQIRAVLYKNPADQYPKFFDPQGLEIEKRLEPTPIRQYEQITDLLGGLRKHDGIDLKAPIGTPVFSPFAGKILRKNWNWKYNGNCLEIDYPSKGIQGIYLHMEKFEEHIKPGVTVEAGQKIGFVGNTGRTTSPHLHYQLNRGERAIDPFKFHKTYHLKLKPEQLADFKEKTKQFLEILDRIDYDDPSE